MKWTRQRCHVAFITLPTAALDALVRVRRDEFDAAQWSLAKAQFAILFGERFTRAMA
jgi:hypothetical protein